MVNYCFYSKCGMAIRDVLERCKGKYYKTLVT